MAPARNMAIFGSSAGGGLTLSMVHKIKKDGLPLPGAIAPGTPMADLTEAGDTFYTNAMIDNVLIARGASCDTRARLYANGHDLKDPLLSPVYGDMREFPPTMLLSGTRDLLLSNTVRMHRKLRQASIKSVLEVFEGMAHGGWSATRAYPRARMRSRKSHASSTNISGSRAALSALSGVIAGLTCLGWRCRQLDAEPRRWLHTARGHAGQGRPNKSPAGGRG